MEGLFVLLVLIVILLPFGTLIGLLSLRANMKMRIERLEDRVERLAALGGGPDPEPKPQAASAPAPAPPVEAAIPSLEPWPEPVRAVALERPPETVHLDDEPAGPHESFGGLFERLVAGKLLIWLGGVALVLSAVFLIRYSIELGLITPALRMAAAALFGLVLLGAGEYARSGKWLSDDPRIAQALVGAGIAVLYATAYGSHILYQLIDTGAASAAMIAVTVAALVLSLRHGAPTAVMGLIGGFLTPVLVGNPSASALPLLAYLALLDMAVFVVAWRRGWTWLAAAAALLSYVWTGYLLTRSPDDALASGAFIILLSLAAAWVKPGEGRQLSLIQPLMLGILQLSALVLRTDVGALAWMQFGALAAAAIALALLRPVYRLAPPLALGLALLLLAVKAAAWQDPWVADAAIGIGVLFGLGGLGLALWKREPLWPVIACVGLAAPYMIMHLLRIDLLDAPAWGALGAVLALGPAALIWADRAAAEAEPPPHPIWMIAGGAAVLLLGAAVWDLVSADWIGAGWLVLAFGAALAARRLGDFTLGLVAILTAVVAVSRCLVMLPDMSFTLAGALIGEPVLAAGLPDAWAALTSLAVPAVGLAAIGFIVPYPARARRLIPWFAGAFALAALYCWYKQAWGLDKVRWADLGMLERTVLTQALFLAGWLFGSGKLRLPRVTPHAARVTGTVLTFVAAARLIWFDIATLNPVRVDQWVGALPVLNLILPAFLLSAVWLYAARRRSDIATRSGFWLAAFLAALVAGTALMVRQGFHGAILTGWDLPIAEFYAYSLAGLLVAIGLIVAGVRLQDKALRLAGLLLLIATIGKVFLVDASALTGVLRILSFLGLGIALMGVGLLYGPVLRAERAEA
jgi:uncharacterized membrane protein